MRALRLLGIAGALAVPVLVAAAPVAAHQSPGGCSGSGLSASLQGPATIARNGDEVAFVASYGNSGPGACDVTDATVTVRLPSADGTPGAGEAVVVAQNLDLPAGTPSSPLPAVPYTVDLDDGVFRSQATVEVSGTLHAAVVDGNANASQSENVVISRPNVTLSVAPAPASGVAPLPVAFTYLAVNDSPLDPNVGAVQPSVADPQVTDDRCAPVTRTGGDADGDELLDPGEAWSYSCATVFGPGTFAGTATFGGTNTLDGLPWPVATAQSSVTATVAPTVPRAPVVDVVKPRLLRLALSRTVFRAARSGPSVGAPRPRIGTSVDFSLSEPSSLRFTVDRRALGRRSGGRCAPPRRSNRAGRACARWVRVAGSFTVATRVRTGSFHFSGRIGDRLLAPGRYRLRVVATDAARNRSATTFRPFRIARWIQPTLRQRRQR